MTGQSPISLDSLDWRILENLQHDARLPVAELARRVGLGSTATADRLRRLVDSGVIVGFRAELDLERVGYPILALVRLRYPTGNYRPLHAELKNTRELLECHHVTGTTVSSSESRPGRCGISRSSPGGWPPWAA